MSHLNPSDAVAQQENLARQIFDELRTKTFDGVGVTRISYGEGEQTARNIMANVAKQLGMTVEDDPAGNVYMTLKGTDPQAKPVVIGSHIDSVAQGGNFDGAAGVVSGLIACAGLIKAGIKPPRDIKVMGIRAEESAWFGVSYIGSRSALGTLPSNALENATRSDTGRTLSDHMRSAGCNPDLIKEGHAFLPAKSLEAYIEVHIEQGPVLEEAKIPVAVVTGIRGNRRLPNATCNGEYSHCGGVPRSHRRDAVIATAELVSFLDCVWDECEATDKDFAFTVGKFFTDQEWHAMTKISGCVEFSLDMRSLDHNFVESMVDRVKKKVEEISERRGVSFDLGNITKADPGVMDVSIKGEMIEGAEALEIPYIQLASGASHDAAAFAAAGVPTQMLFIRNANGSHNPDEAMRISDFMEATRLLAWWLGNKL